MNQGLGPMQLPPGSPMLRLGFVVLAVAVAALFVAAVYASGLRAGRDAGAARRQAAVAAVVAALWIALTGLAAWRGALRFEAPPTMLAFLPIMLTLTLLLAFSPLGRRLSTGLPIAALVGYQSFRIFVELLMHRAFTEGIMPVQMSYSGRNFDIVTGLTALALGAWLATGRRSAKLVLLWNTLGVLLLVNILAVALLSAPTPFRVFMNEPANIWITRPPWIWLPAVMVPAAILGHVLVYRRLAMERRGSAG